MMSATKLEDTKQDSEMDSKEDSTSEEVKASVNMNNRSSKVAVTETAHDETNPTSDMAKDIDAIIKEKSDTLEAQVLPKEDLNSSNTQMETSMEVDTSTELNTGVQSEHIKYIPESQETCIDMDTTDVQTKWEEGKVCPKEVQAYTEEVEASKEVVKALSEQCQAGGEPVKASTEKVNTCYDDIKASTAEVNTHTDEMQVGAKELNTTIHEIETGTKVNAYTEEVKLGTKELNTHTEDVKTHTKEVKAGTEEISSYTKEVQYGNKEIRPKACTDKQNIEVKSVVSLNCAEKSTIVEERQTVNHLTQEVVLTVDKKIQEENLDDWEVLASDEEEGRTGESSLRSGVFEPPPSVIIQLFEKLDKEGVLELEWKCPGRRKLEEDEKQEKQKVEVQPEEKREEDEQKEEEPTAFDFDVPDPVAKVTPRRTPGSAQAQGSGKKRVARMDKVLQNIIRHKQIDDNDFEFGEDDNNEMDTTPQRKLNKFYIRRDLDA